MPLREPRQSLWFRFYSLVPSLCRRLAHLPKFPHGAMMFPEPEEESLPFLVVAKPCSRDPLATLGAMCYCANESNEHMWDTKPPRK